MKVKDFVAIRPERTRIRFTVSLVVLDILHVSPHLCSQISLGLPRPTPNILSAVQQPNDGPRLPGAVRREILTALCAFCTEACGPFPAGIVRPAHCSRPLSISDLAMLILPAEAAVDREEEAQLLPNQCCSADIPSCSRARTTLSCSTKQVAPRRVAPGEIK